MYDAGTGVLLGAELAFEQSPLNADGCGNQAVGACGQGRMVLRIGVRCERTVGGHAVSRVAIRVTVERSTIVVVFLGAIGTGGYNPDPAEAVPFQHGCATSLHAWINVIVVMDADQLRESICHVSVPHGYSSRRQYRGEGWNGYRYTGGWWQSATMGAETPQE